MHSPPKRRQPRYAGISNSRELDLPIVIHCRDAESRLVEIVREVGIPRRGGVIHCFTGDTDAARDL